MAELGGWWLALLLIGVLALPLSGRIFGRLPGLGLAWSKALGLLVVGYSAWLLAMLGFGGFGLGVVALGLAVLAGASGWALRADRELWENIVGRWREWLAWELLFGLLMAAGAWMGVAGDLESGETTVHQRRLGSRVVLRADDPAGFHARVLGSGLLVFAFGAAFVVFGRSLLNEREPVQRGFDAKWELDNAVRRPLDPSA